MNYTNQVRAEPSLNRSPKNKVEIATSGYALLAMTICISGAGVPPFTIIYYPFSII